MNKYELHSAQPIDILVPVEVARKLGFRPGQPLDLKMTQDLRQELGLTRHWPLRTPSVTNR